MTQRDTAEHDRIDEALANIRKAVARQLGVERPPPVDVDPSEVVRFSDQISSELPPEQRQELAERAEQLHPWVQGPFLLGGDLVVGGIWRSDQRWLGLAKELPSDLSGRRVLDVGSNAGYDAFMFRKLGADHVLACEPSDFHQQALFLESIYEAGVDFQQVGWEELDPETHGRFDLVHCNGVLYHELHPMKLIERLRAVITDQGTMLLGSMMLADPELSEYARFVPGSYYGDPTWWWVPGRLALRWMLETAGFRVEHELGAHDGPLGEFRVVNSYFLAVPSDFRQ
jgi:SAM-dependent methyltransferase